jgi:hypothetical protein
MLSLASRLLDAALLAILALAVTVPAALAHETRTVAGYEFVVGFIGEPVFSGQKSGLEFMVSRNRQPVEGLERTLRAEVMYRDQRMDLPLSPRFGERGWYQSVFFPTAAGPYTFHIVGTIQDTPVDETFTSSAEGFDEVKEATSGQFPVQFPPTAELVEDARRGADASRQLPVALGMGAAGAILGLLALGVALAGRRPRP